LVTVNFEDPTYIALLRYTKALSVALGFRDMYTRIHSDRVLAISDLIGRHCGLDERRLGTLRIGAAFHDIGKIGIPDEILLKPGRLDSGELERMKLHAEVGERIMRATELEGSDEAAVIVRHHHERWDGLGYPDGLAGEDIPLGSRIVGIADSYDAMALSRAYHPGKTHDETMAIMHEETGKKHDPTLMSLFVELIERSDLRAER
jgi:HD-GYP domain-containing protein (c-di-GMP phosphodiesterase class II)